ncbi:MAG: DUF255 domain-containing protein [Planctomycetaceae bacterium]
MDVVRGMSVALVVAVLGGSFCSAQEVTERPANRLSKETSPYLLLHAHNPVDWYPWGEEAFEKARKEQKPIFLSIGYSSCYWCHVMEREVFENEDIAKYMNEHFVNIKVDREERPDLDDIYMLSLQVYFQMAQSSQTGGWPMSMFLTPDGKPIAGGTYFPPEDRPGMPGFPRVLQSLNTAWETRQGDVKRTADLLATEVARLSQPQLVIDDTALSMAFVTNAIAAVKTHHDPEFGGLDFDPDRPDGPKFPVPSRLALLQSASGHMPEAGSLQMVDQMLESMAAGGIHDHLGGGFHRYSTDREWMVPHFEKMLYDNAQLAEIYVDAYRRTQKRSYRDVAEGILEYLIRDMSDPNGGFYSALDAETDGVEGEYYVWSREEVLKVLGPDRTKLFGRCYGLDQPQSFEHGYVLHVAVSPADLATEFQLPIADVERQLLASCAELLRVRQQRPSLLRDDKILTSWNGLTIRAFARAGQALNEPKYIKRAEQAALAVLGNMRDNNGRLMRSYRGGQSKLNAYLDDYAFLVSGLLALHEVTNEEKWLNAAQRLTDDQISLFWDEKRGAFFFTTHDHESLIARTKSGYDGALPSGNSVAARNLVRLAMLTSETRYREYAEQTLRAFVPQLRQSPAAMAHLAIGVSEYLAAFGTPEQLAENADARPSSPVPEQPKPSTNEAADRTLVVAASMSREELAAHEHVKAVAYLGADGVPVGGEIPVAVVIQIADGWHINANPAQPDYVIPTTFKVTSSAGGELKGATYPKGEMFRIEGFDDPLSVYEGTIVLRGKLTVPAEAKTGDAELSVTLRYQACNSKNCLRPTNLTLKGKARIVAAGTAIQPVNGPVFQSNAAAE